MAGQAIPAAEPSEVERLRAENARLRAQLYGPPPEPPAGDEADDQPMTVLLAPDPDDPAGNGKLGPIAIANLTRTMLGILRERHPDAGWVAEHDLETVPGGTPCYQLGDVVTKMWDGNIPRSYVVELDDDGEKRLQRILVGAEPGARFRAGYDDQLQLVDDMIREADAAHKAEAGHHAQALLLMIDVVLARLKLALAYFNNGDARWRAVLAEPRPEFDPRGSPT